MRYEQAYGNNENTRKPYPYERTLQTPQKADCEIKTIPSNQHAGNMNNYERKYE